MATDGIPNDVFYGNIKVSPIEYTAPVAVTRHASPLVLSWNPGVSVYDPVVMSSGALLANDSPLVVPPTHVDSDIANPVAANVPFFTQSAVMDSGVASSPGNWWDIGINPVPSDPDYGGQILVAVVSALIVYMVTR